MKEDKLIQALTVFNESISSLENYQAQVGIQQESILSCLTEIKSILGAKLDELEEWKNKTDERLYLVEKKLSQH